MPELLRSVSVSRARPSDWYQRSRETIARKFGLKALKPGKKFVRGFGDRDFAAAWAVLFPSRPMPREHVLGAYRRRRLGKGVLVSILEYRHRTGRVRLRLDLAASNSVPALGADLWLARRLRLPAGFVVLKAQGRVYEPLSRELQGVFTKARRK